MNRTNSPALVVASIALFVSLGGTGYAAMKITGKDVKDESLTGNDVKNRSLRAKDFKPGQLPAGREGPQGPKGATGPAGPPGASVPPAEAAQAVAPAPTSNTKNCAPGSSPSTGQFCSMGVYAGGGGYWRNYGHGFQPARYFKDRSGVVHIEGSVEAYLGTGPVYHQAGATVFVLPPGYRPGATRLFGVYNESAPGKFDYVKVLTDGRVTLSDFDPGNGESHYLQLDGISFRP